MSQTTIAVTILHKIHYSIEVPKTKTDYWFSKYDRVLHHYSVSVAAVVVVVVAAACQVFDQYLTDLRTCRPS